MKAATRTPGIMIKDVERQYNAGQRGRHRLTRRIAEVSPSI